MAHSLDTTTQGTGAWLPAQAPPLAAATGGDRAERALTAAAVSWFVVAVLGQLVFVVYVAGFYGRAALQGHLEAWNKVLPHGYVAGDTAGNLVVGVHLAFAMLITLGGALQIASGVRRRFPTFHRWNGRVYLVACFVMSLGGLFMIATRGTVGGPSQALAISINAVLIMTCAVMAVRYARARRFGLHRRWALRLFLVVNGVWFFRIGLMFWILVNQGPVGFDPDTFRGPALTILAFGQYVVPLLMLELHFRAQDSRAPRVRIAMAVVLVASTLMTATGVVAASMIMWLPRL
jgi:hypothetical protein